MSGLELNKIAASVLIAGIVAMVAGFVADALYEPHTHLAQRGFQVAVTDTASPDVAIAPQEEVFLVGQLMAMADAAAGKENFKKCAICHNVEKGGSAKVGPDLWGVVGADKGHRGADFPYSKALLEKGGKWGYEELFHFLHAPRSFIPGTKMGFAGFKNKTDIANMIAYLRSMSDTVAPLPPVEPAAPPASAVPAAAPVVPAPASAATVTPPATKEKPAAAKEPLPVLAPTSH